MSYTATGVLHHIGQTQQVSDKFKKREFVLRVDEEINAKTITNYIKFQTVQNKCEILDNYGVGQEVTVSFNLKGNKWEREGKENFITNLDAWRVESTGTKPTGNGVPPSNDANRYNNSYDGGEETKDDLPF